MHPTAAPQPMRLRPPFDLLASAFLGVCLGLFVASHVSDLINEYRRTEPVKPLQPPLDPSYKVPKKTQCGPPPRIHQRPSTAQPGCIVLLRATAHTLSLRLAPPGHEFHAYTVHLIVPRCPTHQPIAAVQFDTHSGNTSYFYEVEGLQPDTDYIAELREHPSNGKSRPPKLMCRRSVATLFSQQNYISNPGFEDVASPPYSATSFRRAEDGTPRHWTPFYNGVARRVCGLIAFSESEFAYPRSGQCCLQLGTRGSFPVGSHALFHGVHQAVPFPGPGVQSVVVSAWYRVSTNFATVPDDEKESPEDSLSMVLAWKFDDDSDDDGFSVSLAADGKASKEWVPLCAVIEAPSGKRIKAVHVYFHLHDVEAGNLFVDDISMFPSEHNGFVQDVSGCYTDAKGRNGSTHERDYWNSGKTTAVRNQTGNLQYRLCAEVRPYENQLTLAVPMTSDRVLRLEAMSRLYGGGPIVAAVVVKDNHELASFHEIWRSKAWLRRHVDVVFVRKIYPEKKTALEINALRNFAVRESLTTFVMMVDVDMTPATKAFQCFHDPIGKWLQTLLPAGERRILTLSVFIGDLHHRTASDKSELLNLLSSRAGTSYCLNSQRSNKIKRWYAEYDAIETRFVTDYEPYGIVRRDAYPSYDERFSGYGFNKISWAYWAELAGWRLFLLPNEFITHLNHVENDWVQSIDVPHYLRTWRRFLGFAAECGGASGLLKPELLQQLHNLEGICPS